MANKALVHRPSTTLMTPKGAIDNTEAINFSFTFDGYICKTAELVFYSSSGTVFNTYSYSVTGYNESRITLTLPAGTLTDYTLGYYGVNVGGEDRVVSSVSGKTSTIPNHGFNTGDELSINNKSGGGFQDKQYARATTRDTFIVFPTREMALLGQESGATDLIAGQIVRPWGRSDRVAIQLAVRNLNLAFTTVEIPSQKYTLVPSYNKPPTGNLVVHYRCYIYDINGNTISDSGEVFNGNIQYTFSGFLANTIYQVRFTAVDEYNYIYDTGLVSVSVVFNVPTIIIKPEAVNLCDEGCIQVNWSKITQIIAEVTGSIDYIDNWIIEGNTALQINPNSTVLYKLDIPQESPPVWVWGANGVSGFSGIIARMDNAETGDFAYLSYNDSSESWFVTVNSRTTLIRKEKVVPTNIYLLTFYGATAYIRAIVDLDYKHNELNFELNERTNIL